MHQRIEKELKCVRLILSTLSLKASSIFAFHRKLIGAIEMSEDEVTKEDEDWEEKDEKKDWEEEEW